MLDGENLIKTMNSDINKMRSIHSKFEEAEEKLFIIFMELLFEVLIKH